MNVDATSGQFHLRLVKSQAAHFPVSGFCCRSACGRSGRAGHGGYSELAGLLNITAPVEAGRMPNVWFFVMDRVKREFSERLGHILDKAVIWVYFCQ